VSAPRPRAVFSSPKTCAVRGRNFCTAPKLTVTSKLARVLLSGWRGNFRSGSAGLDFQKGDLRPRSSTLRHLSPFKVARPRVYIRPVA
jgi:hypothetical protein